VPAASKAIAATRAVVLLVIIVVIDNKLSFIKAS
jgi:hypothetical protein